MARRFLKLFATAGAVTLVAGCVVPAKDVDYAAFKVSKPRSIVVLPPLNEPSDVGATYGMLLQVMVPLAEAGYYVLPIAPVDETFRQNGLNTAGGTHGASVAKLHDIFGTDAALYTMVTQYGSKCTVANSSTVIPADTKLVDSKSGQTLWTGRASAPNNEGGNNSGGDLIGMLVLAAVNQIIANVTDQGCRVAGTISAYLLPAGQPGGLLYGPRSPKYGAD